jgi:hypothetical protein
MSFSIQLCGGWKEESNIATNAAPATNTTITNTTTTLQ